jgi:formylglycine-generating enzyme required for sulfatase activity
MVQVVSSSRIVRLLAAAALTGGLAAASAQAQDNLPKPKKPELKATGEAPVDPKSVTDAAAKSEGEMKVYDEVISGPNLRFKMVPIKGGIVEMGSPDSEKESKADEHPIVKVKIEPFWIEEHEVTWDEYEVFMFYLDIERRRLTGTKPLPEDLKADASSRPTPPYTEMSFDMGKEGFPAICMTDFAAKQYTKWLSAKTGRFYRLPTEAEWEYACRAGTKTAYSWGDDPKMAKDYAVYFENSNDKYGKIKTKKPNPWGLYDMHGNVWEWCIDQFDPKWYANLAAKANGQPIDWRQAVNWPTKEYPVVTRGGSWDSDAKDLRSAARNPSDPDWKVQDPQIPKSIWYHTDARWLGFRVVRPLNEPDDAEKKKFWDTDLENVNEILKEQNKKRKPGSE